MDAEHPRTWVTEAIVADIDQSDLVAVRNQCSSASMEDVPATSPRFLRQWVERQGLVDGGYSIHASPQVVSSSDDVEEIVGLLQQQDRLLPVVVLSESNEEGKYPFDSLWLAHRTAGLAHVVLLPARWSYELSHRIGKSLAVYNGAVRTYYPGFGQPMDAKVHPNVLAPRIAEWEEDGLSGPAAFLDFLVAQLHRHSVNSAQKLEQNPGLAKLRREKADGAWRARASEFESKRRELESRVSKTRDDDIELLNLNLEEKIAIAEQMEKSRDEERARASISDQLLETADQDIAAERNENESLRAQNAALFAAIKRARRGQVEPITPDSYDALPSWADEQYSDRILLLPRARRSLKDAVFDDTKLVFAAIQLLAKEYWSLRNASEESHSSLKQAYEDRLNQLRLSEAASITPSRRGEHQEQYTVNYTIGQSSRQILDRHLRGGANAREDRYCLRIYFFWDEVRSLVVIGHLPSHLDTRTT